MDFGFEINHRILFIFSISFPWFSMFFPCSNTKFSMMIFLGMLIRSYFILLMKERHEFSDYTMICRKSFKNFKINMVHGLDYDIFFFSWEKEILGQHLVQIWYKDNNERNSNDIYFVLTIFFY